MQNQLLIEIAQERLAELQAQEWFVNKAGSFYNVCKDCGRTEPAGHAPDCDFHVYTQTIDKIKFALS